MSDTIQGEYHGQSAPLFALYLKTAVLTLLTLGIYRFWAKTRIRKYIWSATSGDGDSFEYTGTGLEKFLGFLIAVVVLAVYLGLLQLILSFFGIFVMAEPESPAETLAQIGGIYISALAVVPLLFFARYRARRYRMARTRWRGLRFGMEKGAWGFVWRALCHLLVTILTLGILYPRQTFYLEKYMADRTWYGDGRFVQTGRWQELYRGLKHVFIAIGIVVVGIALLATGTGGGAVIGGISIFVGYIWALFGFGYYRIFVLNYMASHKVFDEQVGVTSEARLGEVVKIILIGMLVLSVVGGIGGAIFTELAEALIPIFDLSEGEIDLENLANVSFASAVLVLGASYMFLLLVLGGVSLVFINQKIVAHVVSNITIHNAGHLDTVRQRAADAGADAEGFADALDVGSAF